MSFSVRGRRRLDPSYRRHLLLQEAIRVFARRGIGRAGHTEIAQASRVSVATVFNYFQTREILLTSVLDEIEHFLLEMTSAVFEQSPDPVTALEQHVHAFIRACDVQTDMMKIWLEWSSSVRDETWPRYTEFQNKMLKLIADKIQQGIDEGHLSPGLAAMERARWTLGNAHMLVGMEFSPEGMPADTQSVINSGLRHIVGVRA